MDFEIRFEIWCGSKVQQSDEILFLLTLWKYLVDKKISILNCVR